jgi:hypothetical protein
VEGREVVAAFPGAAIISDTGSLLLGGESCDRVLLCAVRRISRPFTNASCGTIRLKLLRIGGLARVSNHRIKIAMASSCPAGQVWGCAAVRLDAAARARGSPA